jgi:hypothetical protein
VVPAVGKRKSFEVLVAAEADSGFPAIDFVIPLKQLRFVSGGKSLHVKICAKVEFSAFFVVQKDIA